MADKLTQPQVAALTGVSPRRIRQIAQEDDSFPAYADGYECAEVGDWLRRRALESVGVVDEGDVPDIQAERAKLTKAQRQIEEMKRAELEGELVRVSLVERFCADVAAAVKAKIRAAGTKLAPRLSAAMTTLEAKAIIDKAHDEALAELSREFRRGT